MIYFKVAFVLLFLAVAVVQGKPSHPFGFHGVFDHLDLAPPVLPPAQFHAGEPAVPFPYHHLPTAVHANHVVPPSPHWFSAPSPVLPAPAPVLPAPAPVLPAPAALFPAPAPLLPAPVPLLPAPAPLLTTPVIHTHTQVIPAAAPVVAPILEALPVAEPIPSYRAIPGPKTTTHHVSVGYAFPQPHFAKLHSHFHSIPRSHHIHAAPFSFPHHHHHHTLF